MIIKQRTQTFKGGLFVKDITVYTIVYNKYGKFIKKWVKMLKKQTVVPNILIVLGHDHGADLDWLKKNNLNYIYYDSDNMGKLRNIGLQEIKTTWWLYFSVDDLLYPHACAEIVNTNAPAISILFDVESPEKVISYEQLSPCFQSLKDLSEWKKFKWGGYIALKNKDIKFREDVEVPNMLYHLDLFKAGIKPVFSKSSLGLHQRRLDSHHYKSEKNGSRIPIQKTISKEISNYLNKTLGNNLKRLVCIKSYKDLETNRIIAKGQIINLAYKRSRKPLTLFRKKELIDKGKAKIV